jgi:cysteine synthase A
MERFITDMTKAIGGTKLLRLDRLKDAWGYNGNIFAKLEHMNPGFSKKDRIALGMIEEAEKRGELKPGMAVVEATSGNTGIGLAIVCAAKGYRFICCMSKGNSQERVKMIEALGSEIRLVDQEEGAVKGLVSGGDLELVIKAAKEAVKETGGFYVDQFNNPDNSLAQELMGEEIWEQSDGSVTAFADFVGTGGTFAGVAKRLKSHNPAVKCYVVEPENSAVYSGKEMNKAGHKIQGGGYGKEQSLVLKSLIDGTVCVSDDEAVKAVGDLAKYAGVFSGFSSGANAAAAAKLLNGPEKGGNVAIAINDCGLKYMSTGLF